MENMNILRRIAIAISGTIVVALMLTLAVPRAAHAVLSALVTVTNTAGNPVPVTGAVTTTQAPQRWNPEFFCANGCGLVQLVPVPKAPSGGDQAFEIQYISGFCFNFPQPLPGGHGALLQLEVSEPLSSIVTGEGAPQITLPVTDLGGGFLFFSQRVDFFASSIFSQPADIALFFPGAGDPSSGSCKFTLNGRLFPETQQ